MNLPKPEEIIPHRDPFLFLTEVTKLEVPKYAEGYWQLTESERGGKGNGKAYVNGELACNCDLMFVFTQLD